MAEFRAVLGRIKMVRGEVWRYEIADRKKLG
jgi:hypothetical protein